MAGRLTAVVGNLAFRQTFLQSRGVLSVQPHRNRFKSVRRGKLPENAKTFQQRLDELNAKDPELDSAVNIGFPVASAGQTEDNAQHKHQQWLKAREKLEYAARHRELKLELSEVKASWLEEQGPYHIRSVMEHYGVFRDLFGPGSFFYTSTPMTVNYDYDDEFVTPVYYGNRIPPSEAAMPPAVRYDADPESLWTLVMTSPDGDLQHNDKECLHWMITNIPGSDVGSGETLCDYLQPFPVKGVGHLRYIFVLYRQGSRLDLGSFRRPPNCRSLEERTFSTEQFYRQHQENITPASVLFFQSEWEESVRQVFHNVLEMPEPTFEFMRPSNYHPAQKRYPHKKPFNLYLDRYRDVRDIQEEVLKERLKQIQDPLTPPSPTPKYPNAVPLPPNTPSWLKLKMKNMRLGRHQWKDLHPQ